MSCSADRTVKLWSLADRAYIDTLYGHQVGWGYRRGAVQEADTGMAGGAQDTGAGDGGAACTGLHTRQPAEYDPAACGQGQMHSQHRCGPGIREPSPFRPPISRAPG